MFLHFNTFSRELHNISHIVFFFREKKNTDAYKWKLVGIILGQDYNDLFVSYYLKN